MSRLADIYRYEKQRGGGIVSTLGSRALEKIDPRQMLNQSGLLVAMLPFLKKYSATEGGMKKPDIPKPTITDTILSNNFSTLLLNTELTAKNTLMLPSMARDINVMRQNIAKLVTVWGEKPSLKADEFFGREEDREAAYESKLKERKPTPTQTKSESKPEGKSGLFGGISNLLPFITGGLKTIFSTLRDTISTVISVFTDLIKIVPQIVSGLNSVLRFLIGPGSIAIVLGLLLKQITDWAESADMNNPNGNPFALIANAGKKFADWVNDVTGRNAKFEQERRNIEAGKTASGAERPSGEFVYDAKKVFEDIEKLEKSLANETNEKVIIATKQNLNALYNAKEIEIKNLISAAKTPQEKQAFESTLNSLNERRKKVFEGLKPNAAPVAGQEPEIPPQPSPDAKPSPTPAGKSYSGQVKYPTTPTSYNQIVAEGESGGKYDTVYGKAGGAEINGKPVTQNTIGEVIEWQNKMRKSNRHAAGKYQFINVKAMADLAGLSQNDLFNAENQERMQAALTNANANALKRQGIEPTPENLALAHSVGAGGASKLLDAQNKGLGNLNAADVLGLSGAGRLTNPHLDKPISQVLAANESKFNRADSPKIDSNRLQQATAAVAAAGSVTPTGTVNNITNVNQAPQQAPVQMAAADASVADRDMMDVLFKAMWN